jgi:hypothetical protein
VGEIISEQQIITSFHFNLPMISRSHKLLRKALFIKALLEGNNIITPKTNTQVHDVTSIFQISRDHQIARKI